MAQEKKDSNPVESLFETVEELEKETIATVTGTIPSWLKGSLLRNGPGKFEFGDSKYNHWFDGQALLHRFTIDQGEVKYYNKFVRGEAFTINTQKNLILYSEFGTNGKPDPCKNIFQRFFSYFSIDKELFTDNCLVNVIDVKGKIYAVSELSKMIEIHPETLEVLNQVNITKEFPDDERIDSALAHPHNTEDGKSYNLSFTRGPHPKYHVTVIPPKSAENTNEKALDGGKILCSVPSFSNQAYFHSFGMTEKYLILMENPLLINIPKILTRKVFGWNVADCFYWYPQQLSRFHIICKETGKVLGIYTAEPTFTFHHVNAFETDTEITVDLCGYDDAVIIQELYLHELRARVTVGTQQSSISSLRRYRLPLPLPNTLEPVRLEKNQEGKDYEVLCKEMELPRVHYELCNGKPYEYVYGLFSTGKAEILNTLIKLNVNTKEETTWGDESLFPSEPVFVPHPKSTDEDDGVVLSVVIDVKRKTTFLLVLDAKSFQELGRAEVPFITPYTTHGTFFGN